MLNRIEIENLATLRSRQGVEHTKFRQGIRALRVGNLVKLVFLSAVKCFAGETLLVRITRIQDADFFGRVVSRPTSAYLTGVQAGSGLAFTADHILSIPKNKPGYNA